MMNTHLEDIRYVIYAILPKAQNEQETQPDMSDTVDSSIAVAGLKAAIRVASHGSFLRAAISMGVSQSQLSRRVAGLENRLGQKLFYRHGRGVALTDFGQRIMPRVQSLIAELEAFDALVSDTRAQLSGDVTVGVIPLVSRHLASSLVRRLQSTHPGIRLRMLEAYSGQVEEWLSSGRVDIGVFNRYGGTRPVCADPLMRGQVSVIGTPDHLLLRQKEIPFDVLQGIPIAMPARPNSLTDRILGAAASHGISLNIALEAGTSSLIQEAMLASGFVTLSPAGTYAKAISNNQLTARYLCNPSVEQTTWIATSRQHPLTAASRAVEKFIKEILYTSTQ